MITKSLLDFTVMLRILCVIDVSFQFILYDELMFAYRSKFWNLNWLVWTGSISHFSSWGCLRVYILVNVLIFMSFPLTSMTNSYQLLIFFPLLCMNTLPLSPLDSSFNGPNAHFPFKTTTKSKMGWRIEDRSKY